MTDADERVTTFVAGDGGAWQIVRTDVVRGPSLAGAPRAIAVRRGLSAAPSSAPWVLSGIASDDRYVTRPEKTLLERRRAPLDRLSATRAALIPLGKSAAWWAMTPDERRTVFEERSRHIRIGLDALPAVARRLYHCRDLALPAAYDFLTWFEYAPEDESLFDRMLAALRASEEWGYVDREVDIRLVRAG